MSAQSSLYAVGCIGSIGVNVPFFGEGWHVGHVLNQVLEPWMHI
jgi:hypothetical protein